MRNYKKTNKNVYFTLNLQMCFNTAARVYCNIDLYKVCPHIYLSTLLKHFAVYFVNYCPHAKNSAKAKVCYLYSRKNVYLFS